MFYNLLQINFESKAEKPASNIIKVIINFKFKIQNKNYTYLREKNYTFYLPNTCHSQLIQAEGIKIVDQNKVKFSCQKSQSNFLKMVV